MNTNMKNTILLIVRILVGGYVLWAGYSKITNINNVILSFGQNFGLSSNIVWTVAIGQVLTGLGVIFGVWTRLAAAGMTVIMLGAVYYTKGQNINAILLLLGAGVLAIIGGGKWVMLKYKSKKDQTIVGETTELPKF